MKFYLHYIFFLLIGHFLELNGFGLLPGEVIFSRANLFSIVSLDCLDIDESRIPTLSFHCILYEYNKPGISVGFGLQENLISCSLLYEYLCALLCGV